MKKHLSSLDTSCRIINEDGSFNDYTSIEEASKETGLTINSIRIRCNKSGTKGKDGKLAMWLNPHTKKHYQAKRNKKSGNSWELEIVNDLKKIGYEECTTSRLQNKMLDGYKVDVCDPSNTLPVYIQAKYLQNTPNFFGIKDECPLKDKPFCICWKKNGSNGHNSPGKAAIIDYEFFLELLSVYNMKNKEK